MWFSETLSPCPNSHEGVLVYTHVAFPHAITFWYVSTEYTGDLDTLLSSIMQKYLTISS